VGDCEAIYSILPDECYGWIKEQEDLLKKQYTDIENICLKDFKDLVDRKTTAMYFKTCKYQSVLFSMLDNYNYGNVIWKIIKPKEIKKYKI